MQQFWEFISLQDTTVRSIVIGAILLAISSSMVGCFTLLRKRALVGDAVAHSVLPGICIAFMLHGTKNPFVLLIGAFIAGWISLVAIDYITSKTRIKEDTAIGLVLSIFFAVGIMLLTGIQNSDAGLYNATSEYSSSKSGLSNFLFGNAASISQLDVYVFGGVAVILIIVTFIFYKEFKMLSFDETFTTSIGFPVRTLQLIMTTLTVFAVVIGIQSVGVVLMSAMLITPAAAARFWTNRLGVMIMVSVLIGVFSSLAGSYISYVSSSPTGPWIVVVLSILAVISFFIAPKKGIITRMISQRKFKNKIVEENILKALFQLGETEHNFYIERTEDQLLAKREMLPSQLKLGLRRLKMHRFIKKSGTGRFNLTKAGFTEGQRVTKLHRLWELYLTEYLNIAPDHVHEDAESIEHIITPEIEARLEKMLGYPELDPHQTKIPYRK